MKNTEKKKPKKTALRVGLPTLTPGLIANLTATCSTRIQAPDRCRPLISLLTVREVAARLRISAATVYALCRSGELEHHRVSNAIRVSEFALARYLVAANTTAQATKADVERKP